MRTYFADKGPYNQSYGFFGSHVWIWELDHKKGWAPKNWCFELWCWRRFLRVPWTVRGSNQSILKEISPEYSLKELMLKLKLKYSTEAEYVGHLMWRANLLEKTLMLGKIKVRRRRGWQSSTWLDEITGFEFEKVLGDGEGQGRPGVHGFTNSQTQLSDWTTIIYAIYSIWNIII